MEVELKLALDPADIARFRQARPLAAVKPTVTRVDGVYFDTPDCSLARQGMALRLRDAGGAWMQGLKAGRSGTGGLHSRHEWEFESDDHALDLARFRETPLARIDDVATLHERLHAAFRVTFDRTAWELTPARGSRLEVALDVGQVCTADAAEAICEVEIECLEGDAWHAQAPLLFAGQLTRPLVLRSRGPVAVIGVRFKPAGAWAFVGATMSSCTDLRIDLATLHGDGATTSLRAQLRDSADASDRIAALSRYVAAQIAVRDGRRDVAIEACVERILASEGRVPLAELGPLAGLGERQLQRRFAEVVGISPRMLGVVVRLRRVFEALRDAPWSTWSERAQAAGFFDHPQMARDFRRLLGTAPTRWAARDPGLATSLADSAA